MSVCDKAIASNFNDKLNLSLEPYTQDTKKDRMSHPDGQNNGRIGIGLHWTLNRKHLRNCFIHFVSNNRCCTKSSVSMSFTTVTLPIFHWKLDGSLMGWEFEMVNHSLD